MTDSHEAVSQNPAPPAGPPAPAAPGTAPAPAAPSGAATPATSTGGAEVRPTRLEQALSRWITAVLTRTMAPYQTAIVRIGFAFTWLLFLLREYPHRHELYGPDGPWSWELGARLVERNGAFTALLWTDNTTWFELVYGLAVAASVGLLVGWRTRAMSVLFMVGVLSLQNRSVFMGDGGDNVVHLMALYLVLTRCGQVWSLDARRRRRRAAAGIPETADPEPVGVALWAVLGLALAVAQLTGFADISFTDRGPLPALGWFPGVGWATVFWGLWLGHVAWWAARRYAPGEPRALLDMLANLGHNAGLLIIAVEVCLIYATAGWYKVQGSRWQDGTAVYYPMHLDYFSPWPALSHLMASSGLIIMVITYGTVIVQVAFPFTVLNRRVKNVLLALMITEHLSIAVMLGLPVFSLVMIAADTVFLPTAALLWVDALPGRLAARLRGRRRSDVPRPAPPQPAAPPSPTVPAQGGAPESRTDVEAR